MTQLQIGKRFEQTFHLRGCINDEQAHEKVLNFIRYQVYAN